MISRIFPCESTYEISNETFDKNGPLCKPCSLLTTLYSKILAFDIGAGTSYLELHFKRSMAFEEGVDKSIGKTIKLQEAIGKSVHGEATFNTLVVY
jgi:demethoxyubiquinone hydroxylase (CLK1/Coq7/Cat5 family)